MSDDNDNDKSGLIDEIESALAGSSSNLPAIAPYRLISDGAWTDIEDRPYKDNPDSAYESEFDIQARDITESHMGPNGEQVDDLDAAFDVRQREKARENLESPHRNINPASWDRGVLGQTIEIKPGPNTTVGALTINVEGDPQLAVFWPGDDREACPITVTVQPTYPLPAGDSKIVNAVAIIEWGIHGAKFYVEVDVGTGFELSLSASSCYVKFKYPTSYMYAVGDAQTNTTYPVSASIGFYSTSRTQAVTRSGLTQSISNNSTGDDVVRPAFATSLVGFERNAAQQCTLGFYTAGGELLFQRTYAATSYITSPISLPTDCYSVRVTNDNVAPNSAVVARLIFGLF